MSDRLPSHFNRLGNNAAKVTVAFRALNRNFIVTGGMGMCNGSITVSENRIVELTDSLYEYWCKMKEKGKDIKQERILLLERINHVGWGSIKSVAAWEKINESLEICFFFEQQNRENEIEASVISVKATKERWVEIPEVLLPLWEQEDKRKIICLMVRFYAMFGFRDSRSWQTISKSINFVIACESKTMY